MFLRSRESLRYVARPAPVYVAGEQTGSAPFGGYFFKWQRYSVAFRDNRAEQHYAVWDYYPAVRTGQRVTIRGDRPL